LSLITGHRLSDKTQQAPVFLSNVLPREFEQIRSIKMVFTISPGRSGTGYLSQALRLLSYNCYHEPEPKFSDVMREVQSDQTLAYEFWVRKKIPFILANSATPEYIETSHLFCKGFAEALLGLGLVSDIVVLRRPRREVATSLYQLDTIPARTDLGLRFLLSPTDPGVLPLPNWAECHDYQLCYWYCLEIERRMRVYKDLFSQSGAKVFETSLGAVTTPDGIAQLISALAIRPPSDSAWKKYMDEFHEKINTKSESKRALKLDPNELDSLEKEIDEMTRG